MKPGAQTLLRALAGTVVPPVSPIKASSAQPDVICNVYASIIFCIKVAFLPIVGQLRFGRDNCN